MATKRDRIVRPNPRTAATREKPWDLDVPLEYLPPAVARACALGLEAGHTAWAGAFSPREPGKTAHFIARRTLTNAAKDALAEAGFERVDPRLVVPGYWYWSAEGGRPRARVGYQQTDDVHVLLSGLSNADRALPTIAACVATRWSLRFAAYDMSAVDLRWTVAAIERIEMVVRERNLQTLLLEQLEQNALEVLGRQQHIGASSRVAAAVPWLALSANALTHEHGHGNALQNANYAVNYVLRAAVEALPAVSRSQQKNVPIETSLELCDVLRFWVLSSQRTCFSRWLGPTL